MSIPNFLKPKKNRKVKAVKFKKSIIFGRRCYTCFAGCCWKFCKLYESKK